MQQRLKNIEDSTIRNEKIGDSNCKKLDALKMWIIALLGTALLSLVMQFIGKS